MKVQKKLFFNEDKSRQFLIQEDLLVPKGNLKITAINGEELYVNPESAKEFEISKKEANVWLQEQFKVAIGQLKTGLKETLFHSSSENNDTNESNQHEPNSNQEEKRTTPGLDLLADITNTPRKSMDDNYSAIGQALKTYLKDVTSTVTDGVSGEPDRQESSRERMKSWGKTLQEHGIKAPDIRDDDKDK